LERVLETSPLNRRKANELFRQLFDKITIAVRPYSVEYDDGKIGKEPHADIEFYWRTGQSSKALFALPRARQRPAA
jgi:hypothetical protein